MGLVFRIYQWFYYEFTLAIKIIKLVNWLEAKDAREQICWEEGFTPWNYQYNQLNMYKLNKLSQY